MVDLQQNLVARFRWRGDRPDKYDTADVTGWWRAPEVLTALGPALGDLFRGDSPSVVLGVESSGFLLGPLVAVSPGVGFVEMRKDAAPAGDSDAWVRTSTPPDHRDRQLNLAFRRADLRSEDRVLLVDDWVETGGQALGAQSLVEEAGAAWLGVATIVDALDRHEVRRSLNVRSLLHLHSHLGSAARRRELCA